MAFGAQELRVLRRALALALHPGQASAEDVQDCLRLAESLDEAVREGVRLAAFLVADLARYRATLPGTAAGYCTLLEEALSAGYRPLPDDLAALRALRGNPAGAALLDRCQALAEQDVRARPARGAAALRTPLVPAGRTPHVPASRSHLQALPGGRSAGAPGGHSGAGAADDPASEPEKKPAQKPGPAQPASPAPKPARRPVPTPGEVFPRRKPPRPPAPPSQRLAVG
ncbi:hypothetical protein [Streptomyces cadmiisoli]|uniref:Uncharacterized protein n=2 Tax=Streptomyces TaxID=1883 RepID=A0A2Z4IZL7_9ACTN|nr:hypothetical protein [Streptomyces cadmiisoli]AWW38322.1 hypothetical protein DN051_18055 [Streptomyces cadmiisoli]